MSSVARGRLPGRLFPRHPAAPFTAAWILARTPTTSRRNLCPNPAVHADTTGWVTFDATRTAVTGMDRPWAMRFPAGGYGNSAAAAVTEGETYTGSAQVRRVATGVFEFFLEWYGPTGDYIGNVLATPAVTADVPIRVSLTATAPAGATQLIVGISAYPDNQTIDGTAVLIEAGAVTGTYADGETTGWAWDGTRYNSTSSELVAGAVRGVATGTGSLTVAVVKVATLGGACVSAAVGAAATRIAGAVTQTGAGVAGAVSAVAPVKRTAQTGTTASAPAGSGGAVKRAASGGRATTSGTSTGSTGRRVPVAGPVTGTAIGTGAIAKRAIPVGRGAAAPVSTTVTTKRTTAAGSLTIPAAGTATARKTPRTTASIVAAAAVRASAAKTIRSSGATTTVVVGTGRPIAVPIRTVGGSVPVTATPTALAEKRAATAGAATSTVSPVTATAKTIAVIGRVTAVAIGSRSGVTPRTVTGACAAVTLPAAIGTRTATAAGFTTTAPNLAATARKTSPAGGRAAGAPAAAAVPAKTVTAGGLTVAIPSGFRSGVTARGVTGTVTLLGSGATTPHRIIMIRGALTGATPVTIARPSKAVFPVCDLRSAGVTTGTGSKLATTTASQTAVAGGWSQIFPLSGGWPPDVDPPTSTRVVEVGSPVGSRLVVAGASNTTTTLTPGPPT